MSGVGFHNGAAFNNNASFYFNWQGEPGFNPGNASNGEQINKNDNNKNGAGQFDFGGLGYIWFNNTNQAIHTTELSINKYIDKYPGFEIACPLCRQLWNQTKCERYKIILEKGGHISPNQFRKT